jgi:putative polymerase
MKAALSLSKAALRVGDFALIGNFPPQWTAVVAPPSLRPSPLVAPKRDWLQFYHAYLCMAVVAACTLFNFVLCLVNAQGITLGRGPVVAAEMVLMAIALALIAARWSEPMRPWAYVILLLLTINCLTAAARDAFDPKYLRDVVIIPVYIMLGISCASSNVRPLVIGIQALVLIVTLWEGMFPSHFSGTMDIVSYYLNKGDLTLDEIWNPDNELFVSAMRPDDRFLFDNLDIHRLSSVFLEPVSLGNYVVIVWLITLSLWSQLGLASRIFLLASNFVLLVGCDGRLAAGLIAITLALRLMISLVPSRLNLLYAPLVVAVGWALVEFAGFQPGRDNFEGRVAHSIHLLSNMKLLEIFALDGTLIPNWDSGIHYVVVTQSILVVVFLWTAICVFARYDRREQIFYNHGLCIYVVSTLMISYSLFSVKTAALLWFIYGYMNSTGADAAVTVPASAVPRPTPWGGVRRSTARLGVARSRTEFK